MASNPAQSSGLATAGRPSRLQPALLGLPLALRPRAGRSEPLRIRRCLVRAQQEVGSVATPTANPFSTRTTPVRTIETTSSRGGNIYLDSKYIVMLQAFNWPAPDSKEGWWNVVKRNVGDIAALGITDVWLPPPSKAVDANGYMPTELYNLNASSYGNEGQLRSLLDAFHQSNIRVEGDIVINHRSGEYQDQQGNWTGFEGGTPDRRLDWAAWAIPVGDKPYGGQGRPDTGADYAAAPDVDHTNPQVQTDIIQWLNWLKQDVGFDGWRFDFVKGYDGQYTDQYVEKSQPVFAVGEFWDGMQYNGSLGYNQDAHRQRIVNWIDRTKGTSAAFDFTTKGILQEAVRNTEFWRLSDQNNKPPGVIGWWPERAVTFVDNHDTGSTQNFWPFPSDKVMQGYAYILTHPGIPCIFWDHVFDWGLKDQIKQLINIRKRNGINASSKVEILDAHADLYLARIDGKVVVKLGPRFNLGNLSPDPGVFKLATSGNNFAVWEHV